MYNDNFLHSNYFGHYLTNLGTFAGENFENYKKNLSHDNKLIIYMVNF